jgi:DNA-binding transcriptional LysR family regulator
MNNRPIDLNLLLVFDAVNRHRNVSRAAESIGLSQPAVSNALRRLRAHLKDRLFVRTAAGMMPTAAAEELGGSVSAALSQITNGLVRRGFDPATESRTFTLLMTDIGNTVFLPKLLDVVNREAPAVAIRTVHLPAPETRHALESGTVDLATAFVPELRSGVMQQRLFVTDYVCIVRRDHPTIRHRMSRAQFLGATHIIAEAAGTGHSVVASALARLRPSPRIGLRVPQFLALPVLVGQSDMIATVPLPLAREFEKAANIKILPVPLKLPRVDIKLLWHERYHDDPANRWLRGTMSRLFKDASWA